LAAWVWREALFYKYFFLSGKPFDLFFQQQMEGLNEQTAERGVLLERARQVSTPSNTFIQYSTSVLIFIIYKQ
jgi:hypothetical protein